MQIQTSFTGSWTKSECQYTTGYDVVHIPERVLNYLLLIEFADNCFLHLS